MSAFEQNMPSSDATAPIVRKLLMLGPGAAALAYPYLLRGFHLAVFPPGEPMSIIGTVCAFVCLLGAIAVPLLGLACAGWLSRTPTPSSFELRARRLAYLSIAAPPLFVFMGVTLGLLGLPIGDKTVWIAGWLAASAYVWFAGEAGTKATTSAGSIGRWRVAHGVSAALIACFVLFHLANHLLGWMGPDVHRAVMEIGRGVYRSRIVEPILIALLLFQVVSGARLAWRWSAGPGDAYRVFQIGSGAYLAAFIVTHMNSALVSARAVRNIETDWAWASGAPAGLIHDAWNIRLVPHYGFGVFFILAHLSSGLRQVVVAHGVDTATADRIWVAGLIVSGLVSVAIMSGLCGARI